MTREATTPKREPDKTPERTPSHSKPRQADKTPARQPERSKARKPAAKATKARAPKSTVERAAAGLPAAGRPVRAKHAWPTDRSAQAAARTSRQLAEQADHAQTDRPKSSRPKAAKAKAKTPVAHPLSARQNALARQAPVPAKILDGTGAPSNAISIPTLNTAGQIVDGLGNVFTPGSGGDVPAWVVTHAYTTVGQQVSHGGQLYSLITSHTSSGTFDASKWLLLGQVPPLVVTATSPLVLPDVIQVFAHSYGSGAMTNPTTNRQTAKLAKACKGVESNHAVAASVLSTHSNVGGLDVSTPPAGIVGVLQTVTAPRTPGTDMFLSGIECAVLCWGINDWALMGGANFATIFPANLHTAIRRIRAGAIFEDTHASVTFPTGTWSPVTSTLVNSGAGAHFTASNAATAQIAVPSQYAGQPITLGFIDTGVVGTVTVTDETSANQGSVTLGGFAYTENAKVRNGYPSIHIPGGTLAAGTHTLTLTYSQTGGGNLFFDYWSIGADSTPLILIELANRIPDYTKHAVGWPNAPLNDAAITTMNTIMQTVASAYTDGHVICVPVDDIIGNNAANLCVDGVHPNSGPAGLIAQRMLATLQQANQGRADILRLGTA